MSGIEVDESAVDQGTPSRTEADALAALAKLPDFCNKSPWIAGIQKMKKVNYVVVKNAADARSKRKRVMAKFIVTKVKEMSETETMEIGEDKALVDPAPWSVLVHGLNRSYYSC